MGDTVEAAGAPTAVAADFMEAEEAFTAVEDFPAVATQATAVDIITADIMAVATTVTAAVMAGVGEATAGVEEVGATDTAMAGAAGDGVTASGGPMRDGDIRMVTTATPRGITRPATTIPTRITDLPTIRQGLRIPTVATTIRRRRIATRGRSRLTRMRRRDRGDRLHREAQGTQTSEIAALRALRRVGRCCPLTGLARRRAITE